LHALLDSAAAQFPFSTPDDAKNNGRLQPVYRENIDKTNLFKWFVGVDLMCKEEPFWDEKCVVVKFGVFSHKIPLKWVGMGNYQPKYNAK